MTGPMPAPERAKGRYGTLCSGVFHAVWMLFLLSLASWFLLAIGLGTQALVNNTYSARQAIHRMNNIEREFLASQQLSACLHERPMIHSSLDKALNELQSFLQKAHYFIRLANLQTMMAWAAIAAETTEIVLGRLAIFILSLPLWAGILFVMAVDGLVQRDVRKFQAARESTFLFHRLKLLTGKLFYFFFLFYMCVPWAIEPLVLLLPMITIVSAFVMLTIKHYKKYL